MNEPLILFDGVCNLCSGTVTFVLKRDRKQQFRFASLQSESAQQLLAAFEHAPPGLDSVLLVENGKLYDKSTAILRILRHLSAAWPFLYVFIIIPRPIRNVAYDVIGRNRYRWFGKKDVCWVPPDSVADRFIDQAAT